MRIQRFSEAIVMPWKNGLGETSQFPGYDRWLVVWEGTLDVNGRKLRPFDVLNFRGEDPISAQPVAGPVKDLGLIFRRGKVCVEAEVRKFHENIEQSHKLDRSQHLWVQATGQMQVDGSILHPGDGMFVQGVREIVTKAGPDARTFCLKITNADGYFNT